MTVSVTTPTPTMPSSTSDIREAPTISPSSAPEVDDPATPAAPDEPVLDIDDIQGNLLVGFNKDHVMLIFLTIDDAPAAKVWLRSAIRPLIASASEVLAFNRLFKAARLRRQFEGTVKATWINIAMSAAGLAKLTPDVTQFADASFKAGAAAQSPTLNDPQDPAAEGAPVNWRIGGSVDPDVVLIVASDDEYDLYATVQHLEEVIYTYGAATAPTRSGVHVVFKQLGHTQPGAMAGHEHFGWLDGISQPGLRGRLSADPNDVLTPRQNTADPNQGKPGQDLLWPGEFVFGYPGQGGQDVTSPGPDSLAPGGAAVAPGWAKNGSYLVFRRLRQDVGSFHQLLHDQAATASLSAETVGSRLVGRWPSGAPVLRSPSADAPAIGADDCANNHFEFQTASVPSTGGAASQCDDSGFPPSPGDVPGLTCPFSSHIRKTYPRDDTTLSGQPNPYAQQPVTRQLDEADTQTHRLLRRGIPYGPSSGSTPHAPTTDDADRGLLFMAYMTSIIDQFEFVTRNWVNDPDFKEQGTGLDPILGQASAAGQRTSTTVYPGDTARRQLDLPQNWVIPTGGAYFFAPSLSALSGAITGV